MLNISQWGLDLIFLGAIVGAMVVLVIGVLINLADSETGPVQLDGDVWCSYASVNRALFKATEGKDDWRRHEAHQMLRFYGQRP